jgi:hypothetical protein
MLSRFAVTNPKQKQEDTLILALIKGQNPANVNAAAKLRGITVKRLESSNAWGETRIYVSDYDHDKITKWFIEPSEHVSGVGYPEGTLLYYSHLPNN